MHADIQAYNAALNPGERALTDLLADAIDGAIKGAKAENKIWHGHPVWFLEGNPIVGYSKQKAGMRLMFWSGADFEEPELDVVGKKFKDASIFYADSADVDAKALKRWLKKSKTLQWNYRDIVKRKGKLERLS